MDITAWQTWLNMEMAAIPSLTAVLFILALLISALGFYRTVYFISIGYAFSITTMALAASFALRQNLTVVAVLQNLFLAAWGLRLGIFLVRRELRPSYRREMVNIQERGAGLTFARKLVIWVAVSLLYVCMFSPSLFTLAGTAVSNPFPLFLQWLGLLVMGGGLLLETTADKQKSDFKAENPRQFCNVGLYHLVRCPNYLGEILFWVGNWIIGLAIYATVGQWVISLIGVVCIVLIMMGSTKRLERQQDERYGDQPAYQAYIRSVPVLFPFVPLYTLKNVRVYLE